MYYIYILRSKKDRKFYTGSTNSLRKRFKEHYDNTGYLPQIVDDHLNWYITMHVQMNKMPEQERSI